MNFRKLLCALTLAMTVSMMAAASAFSQQKTVSGTVTDESGEPVMGVAVIIKNTTEATMTGYDGKYAISVEKGETLQFSFLGMAPREITVADADVIDVTLYADREVLDEVLVVAYGTAKKESFTGSAETVKGDRFKSRTTTDITKMIDGQVAGVMATSGGGQPGSGAELRIRGFGSINASNSPLIVVDGVPFDGDLNSISSSDIESMSVLKDASAGALYGARGANGVVLITTKRQNGEEGKLNVNLSAKFGVSSRAIPEYETLTAKEYMELMYTAAYNDLVYTEGYLPSTASTMVTDRLSRLILGTDDIYNIYDKPVSSLFDSNGKIVSDARMKYDENWIEEAEEPFPTRQEYQISVNGSSGASDYYASLSYLDEKGILKTTGFTRYTIRAGADMSPKKWFDMGASINYSHSDSQFLGSDGTTNNTNVWYSAMLMAPIYPVYEKNQDGSDVLEGGERVFDYGMSRPAGAQNNRNSVATLFDDDYYTISDNLTARGYAAVSWKGLKLTSNIGVDNVNAYESTNFNRHSGNATGTGRLTKETGKMTSYTWNQLLSYDREFGKHAIDAMAGHEFYHYEYRYLIGERTGFPFDEYDELGMGATIAEGNSASDRYAIDSYLFRLNYSYADKYYLSGSFRMDASSRFKKENRWGAFWSVGASWRISQENFLKDVDWINNMTIKASYGVQGNDNLGSYYAWQSLYNMNYPNGSESGAVIGSIENQDVTWEKNGNLNIGLEFRLLDRISGTIEWYDRRTDDLLLESPMAISLGFPGYYDNVGSISNSGFDITLGADIISTQDMRWNVTLIGSTLRNRVLKLTDDGKDIVNGVYIIREGEEINSFYMAKSAGVDPATGEQLYWAYEKDADGNMVEGSEYVTSNATTAASCKYLLGSRIPDLYGSISTSFRYRNFDLSLLFTYSIGGKVYDSIYNSLMEPAFVGQTYHRNVLRAWTGAGQVTDVPKVTTNATTQISDRFLIDASYFGVKNISIGYNFPEKWMEKLRMNSMRIYLTADSPWLFTHLKGMNPQSSFTGSTSYSYTPNRTFSIGLDLSF